MYDPDNSDIIEFYCSGSEIRSRIVHCDDDKLLGLSAFEGDKPYCLNSGTTVSTENVVMDYIKNVGNTPPFG